MRFRRFSVYAVILAMVLAAPFILRDPHQRELLVMTCIWSIAALSWDMIMGTMGQFSFGHQAFLGIGAYVSALLTLRAGVPVWVGLAAAVGGGAVAGFIIGYVSLRLTRGFALAIVTLGFGLVLWQVACRARDITGGLQGLPGLLAPMIAIPGLPKIELSTSLSYYYLTAPLLLLTLYFIARLLHSRFGRAVTSIRENEDVASSIGVDPTKYYILMFTIATALAGLSGGLYAHYQHIAFPGLLGMSYIFMMVIMVLVGGSGTLWGPVLGAAIFVWVPEYMPLGMEYRFLFFGIIILLTLIFMPRGLYPGLVTLWNRFIVSRVWSKKNTQ